MQHDLDLIKHSFLLGLLWLYDKYDPTHSSTVQEQLRKKRIPNKIVVKLVQDAEHRFLYSRDAKKEHYVQSLARSTSISLYELCKSAPIYNTIKKYDWFVFLANLRHSFAHGVSGYRRITFYGKKHIVYTRQIDLENFFLNPRWDGEVLQTAQYGGLLTIWDLFVRVERALSHT